MTISKQELQINEEIRDKEILVIDADGKKLGVLSSKEAQQIAFDQELDLVKIAPQATPPVCRIMDYGKYCFEQQKREKEARKNQKVVSIKELQLEQRLLVVTLLTLLTEYIIILIIRIQSETVIIKSLHGRAETVTIVTE